jgi:molecular chaperone DnaK (HSP70)
MHAERATAGGHRIDDPIVGIDLGTTNSLVAIADGAGPRVLLDDDGAALLPSVVRFDGLGRAAVVGRVARDEAVLHPARTIFSAKRLIGRSADELRDLAARLPYEVVPGPRGVASVRIAPDVPSKDASEAASAGASGAMSAEASEAAIITPQEVAAHVLAALRGIAERRLGCPVRRAVVTVPAYFDDAQRQATRDAGRMAGLEILRIVNEPTAASLAYGIGAGRAVSSIERIAVYDFGGGTFDISVLERTPRPAESDAADGVPDLVQVLATAGDTALGGDDIDRALIDLLMREMRAAFGLTLAFPPSAQQALRRFAESAKVALSDRESTDLAIDMGDGRLFRRTLRREELEALAQPFVDRTLACCRRALADAGLAAKEIDRVVLVGGSTRMPLVRTAVAGLFGRTPYTALDPDQVVALGAAVQASILAGSRSDLLLFDVVPLSLGIETVGGAVAKLIMRNATIPTRAKEMFSTSVDGQVHVRIHVLQGERELVQHCRSLGQFELRGIPPMPAGIPQIEVELLVDQNGVLDVSAVERRSGKRAAIQVVPSYGLTSVEVDRIERESFAHARSDMHVHRVIDLRVNANLDLQWIGAALDRVRDALEPAVVAEVEARMAALRGFVAAADRDAAGVDANAFHAAKEALDAASVPVHEASITRSLRGETAG